MAVLRRLEPLDEMSAPDEVDAVFPWAGTRPDMAVHWSFLSGERGNTNPPAGLTADCSSSIGLR